MPHLKLTSAAVTRIKPPARGQEEYFDKLLPSFGLRISYSGTKAWFVMTRVKGKLIRLTIGRFPGMSLADARAKARGIMDIAATGIDPRHIEEEKRRVEAAATRSTFELLAEEFMAKHVRPNLRNSTAKEYQRILFGLDTQAWRTRPISSIEKRDVLDLVERIAERSSPGSAALSLAYLRKFFNWCADREVIDTPPTDRIRLPRATLSRDRVLSETEIGTVWGAFKSESGLFGPLFELLLFTGQRRAEVAGMRWDELHDLDGDTPYWEIPGMRTKNYRSHLVSLTVPVVEIILAVPRTGPYLFSTTGKTPVSGFSKAKRRIDASIAEAQKAGGFEPIEPWTLHDLRRTMVTVMNEDLGVPPHVVEAVVNHMSGAAKAGVAGVYNRALYVKERKRALERWSKFLRRIK
jgi:integrase